jgi:hypothetical protein
MVVLNPVGTVVHDLFPTVLYLVPYIRLEAAADSMNQLSILYNPAG